MWRWALLLKYIITPLIRIKWDDELSGYAENPDNCFLFENRLHWQFEGGGGSTNGCFRLHIYLRKNKTLLHNSLYVVDNWGKHLSYKEM